MLSSASGDYGETGSSLLLSLTLLTASLLFTSCAKNPELAEPGETPNVIVIYVDDVGWVDLESYGSEFYETPNIDSLLSQGLRFTQATPMLHSAPHRASACSPGATARAPSVLRWSLESGMKPTSFFDTDRRPRTTSSGTGKSDRSFFTTRVTAV